jgi:phytoene desaturase
MARPLFYANFPSLTDKTAAPEGMAFFLVPLAPGIKIQKHSEKNTLIK